MTECKTLGCRYLQTTCVTCGRLVIEKILPERQEWISVEDKLPEKSGRYLIFIKKEPHAHNCLAFNYPYPCCKPNIAYYVDYANRWEWNSRNEEILLVTHWMPLPSPPEKS